MVVQMNNKSISPNNKKYYIPNGWQVKKIGDICKLSSGNTPSRRNKENFSGNILWVTSGELKNKYISETNEMISEQVALNNGLSLYFPGTVIIALYGLEADGIRGTCSIVERECTISQACMAFTNLKEVESEYLYYWYKNNGNSIGLKYAQGTKQQNLSTDVLEKIDILLPTICEQKCIIKYLSIFDELMEKVQKLIVSKQEQRCWLMQNLLTGKKRLLGFSKSWKKAKLREFLDEVNEKNRLIEILEVKSVNNKLGFINQNDQFGKNVASDDLSHYKIVKNGNIAYNPSRINVGSIALYSESVPGIISPMYIVFNTKKELDEKYFMYYLKTESFNQCIKAHLSGSVRASLKFADLCAIKIILPDYKEQKAIVNVLETADKEIALLEHKLELIKKEQKAMMQLLLTGIVRVNDK